MKLSDTIRYKIILRTFKKSSRLNVNIFYIHKSLLIDLAELQLEILKLLQRLTE